MAGGPHPTAGPGRGYAVRERDAALARVGRVRRWTIAGAAALTAGFAALVSAIAPGRSLGAGHHAAAAPESARASTGSRAAAPALPPLASPSQLGLQGPSEPPQAAPDPTQSAPAPADPSASPSPAPAPAPAAPASPPVTSGGS